MTQKELQEKLLSLAQEDYRKFSEALVPGVTNMLGVRLPALRRLAKKMAASGNWKTYLGWKPQYFEETMLQGMLLGYLADAADVSAEEILAQAEAFVPKIDNWSVNDSFCTTFHCASKYPKETWAFLMEYIDSREEFKVRMTAVMLMTHYLNTAYIDRALDVLGRLDTQAYYASMAVAWAFATAWAKFPEKTRAYLATCPPDRETYLRTLQKCVESRRISAEDKAWMREERKRVRRQGEVL